MQHLNFLFLGLASGAVFASLAMALVVTYRSSGVLNFATGACALVGAYEYAFLRNGELLLLIPGLPATIDIGTRLGLFPALVAATALSALLGLGAYVFAFRPLRESPDVAKAVASLGLMVLLTGLVVEQAGVSPISVEAIFPSSSISMGDARLPLDRLWFAIAVVALSVGLAATFRFTRFGLHTRAAAESEKGAVLSSIRTDRIAALNWLISGATAGLAGILIAPLVPLVPVAYALFIVPALAAAVLGGFQRLWPAVLGGLAIGMLQSEIQLLKGQHNWLPQAGLAELLPLVVILVVLVVRAKPLPGRGAITQRALGRSPRPTRFAAPAVVGLVAGAGALVVLDGPSRVGLVTSLIMAVVALSLVVLTGYAGQVSLAQLPLAGVGGFALAQLTTGWGVPFPVAPLLAAIAAMVVGVVVGLPAIRIRGLSVAVVTLCLAVALEAVWFQNSQFVSTVGEFVAGPTFLGVDLRARAGTNFPRLEFCLLVLGVVVATAFGVARLRTSRLGSAMLAVRANERAAAASGIDVVRTKLIALAVSGFIAGLGGALLGYKQGNVTFDAFNSILGLTLFATVYLCGITSVSGALVAGLLMPDGLLTVAVNRWVDLGNWLPILGGLALIVTLRRRPDGVVAPLQERLARLIPPRPWHAPSGPATPPDRVAPSSSASGTPALRVEHLVVQYGGIIAVDDVTLEVPAGKIVGLIGPNGAGKTSFVDAVSGLAPSKGVVQVDGATMHPGRPHRRVHAGLGRTFQGLDLWYDLSVAENVLVGVAGRGPRGNAHDLTGVLTLLNLRDLADERVRDLSRGHQQLVSIARALVTRPSILLLDEPAAGLDTSESTWLAERLRDVRDAGSTILLIDHDMSLVLNLCDEIHVLNFGSVIASGTPEDVSTDEAVIAAYLGDVHAAEPPAGAAPATQMEMP